MAKQKRHELDELEQHNNTTKPPVSGCLEILNKGQRQYTTEQAAVIRDLLFGFAEIARYQYENNCPGGKLANMQNNSAICISYHKQTG